MLIYPQLSTGATAQYPVSKSVSQRTIQSVMEDGTSISSPDQSARFLTWRIPYEDLSTTEAETLSRFFLSVQGSLLPFLFLDPMSNLLSWSEDYTQSAWGTEGFSFQTGIGDPFGGSHAMRAHNATAHDQSISQATDIPGCALTCFSIYLRASASTTAQLNRTAGSLSQSTSLTVTPTWQRFTIAGSFPSSVEPSRYAVIASGGASLDVFGAQVDSQSVAAAYVSTAQACGVHTNARFDMPRLEMIASGPNRNACVIAVRSNIPRGDWA